MSDTALTPDSINNKRFRIPLYQRPYAWQKEQVEQLLDDLYASFNNKGGEYYIGILSVAATEDSNMYDLIDGQQRITTLMLIGKAAKQFIEKTDNYWNDFLGTAGNVRLELYGRNKDEAFLLSDDAECSNINLKNAYTAAVDYFKEKKKEGTSVDFSKYIYEYASFFLSEMPKDYTLMDKNQHFVRMNNRGKQLEQHEILKVTLIGGKTDKEDKEKQNNYFNIWNSMVELLKDIPEEKTEGKSTSSNDQNPTPNSLTLEKILAPNTIPYAKPTKREPLNWAIVTIPEFLLIALARHCSNSADISHDHTKLTAIFKSKENDINIVEFMDLLEKQIELLKNYFIFVSKNDDRYSLGKKRTWKEDVDKGEEQSGFVDKVEEKYADNKKRLINIQSFLHVSTEPHFWLIDAFDWLQNNIKVRADDFCTCLEKLDNKLISDVTRKPKPPWNDGNMKEVEMTYGNLGYYWFYRLDYELLKAWHDENVDDSNPWGNKSAYKDISEKIKTFRFRKCNSIEHIIPQTPEVKNDATKKPDDSFGNIALIQGEMNSRLRNYNINGKKELILNSEIQSLKMVHFLWGKNANAEGTKDEGTNLFSFLQEKVKYGISNANL